MADLTATLKADPVGRVLLDAACSGTGTLRGHREIKLWLGADDITDLASLQCKMLANAAKLVAPGGRLVYAVCALTNAEGPGVVAEFLRGSQEFGPEEFSLPLPTTRPVGSQPGQFILPVNGLDGFYVARLKRAP